ncbi:MAG: hypothetical protein AAF542_04620 [Pseudomonadota bacterium]
MRLAAKHVILGAFILLNAPISLAECLPNKQTDSPVAIDESSAAYSVRVAGLDVCISKQRYDLTVYQNGSAIIEGVSSSVAFKNKQISIGKPSEFYSNSDQHWIELRGWYSRPNNLWFITRYQFFPDQPGVKISFTITDRHDDHPSEGSWDREFWHKRIIKDWRFAISTGSIHQEKKIEQINAYSGGVGDVYPLIIADSKTDSAYWDGEIFDDNFFQISHAADQGRSSVRIYPRLNGEMEFTLQQRPLTYPYPSNDRVTAQVVNANQGKKRVATVQTIDQQHRSNRINGIYTMDYDDYVEVLSTGREDGDRTVFSALNVKPTGSKSKKITARRMPDAVLESQQFALNIKDFWKKYPIKAEARDRQISWTAINEPTYLYGGAGLTIDFALSFNNETLPAQELQRLSDRAPTPSWPNWWLAMDGKIFENRQYLDLLKRSQQIMHNSDRLTANWGWKNHGDYQIGVSYHNEDNVAVVDWGALQYDLTLGLLLSWMNTGDVRLWDRARAAVRNAMDIKIAKFHPYLRKQSGAGLRKGVCPVNESHWCQPAIPEFNYHSRSLLLYSHLTGEQWPKEIARMLIDNSAYFALTRTEWTTKHDRISGWALRNLYYGHVLFGEQGTRYISTPEPGFTAMPAGTSYKKIANHLVASIVNGIEIEGGLGGGQPVWSAQTIEGLIIALENDMLEAKLRARTRRAIETAVNQVVSKQLIKKGGAWWMVYDDDPIPDVEGEMPELRNFNSYGWFWVNSLAWVSINTHSDHSQLTKEVIGWLTDEHSNNWELQNPRAWSGVMGFPSYAIGELMSK